MISTFIFDLFVGYFVAVGCASIMAAHQLRLRSEYPLFCSCLKYFFVKYYFTFVLIHLYFSSVQQRVRF